MGIPLQIGDVADAVDVSIQSMWFKSGKLDKEDFKSYYNVSTGITDETVKDSSLSGLGKADRILENAVVVAESPIQGYDKSYTQVEYGKLLAVTKRMTLSMSAL